MKTLILFLFLFLALSESGIGILAQNDDVEAILRKAYELDTSNPEEAI